MSLSDEDYKLVDQIETHIEIIDDRLEELGKLLGRMTEQLKELNVHTEKAAEAARRYIESLETLPEGSHDPL